MALHVMEEANRGSIMVAWDNGCGLNVVLDEDEIEIIPAESNH